MRGFLRNQLRKERKVGDKLMCLKCRDVIESKSVHDFRRCRCGAIFIDGGDEYTRYGGYQKDMEWVEEEKDYDTTA